MTNKLTLILPTELYRRLQERAAQQHKGIEELALEALQQEFPLSGLAAHEDPLAHADSWAPPTVPDAPQDLAEEHDDYAYGGNRHG